MTHPKPWFQEAYRRNVIDMHISDDDPSFLTAFDPLTYVDRLVEARVQSTVLYAHSHTGLCTFPTRVGQPHPGLGGRDALGEVLALCHQKGISVVAYMSLIFDDWAYRTHPDWRILDPQGVGAAEHSRYGVCCPNSPYRQHVVRLVEELCAGYDFDGIRFDMTFWPRICYCRYCRERFANEVGGELPTTIDWDDAQWVAFQRSRERWLVEFAALATATVREKRPSASIEHQSSTYPHTWRMGLSTALAEQNDFLQGDFYGDALQGSFSRKLLGRLSPKLPAGFETSISPDLTNPTTLKSESLLRCKAAAALADGAAFIMIDSIDPIGTLNPQVYRLEGKVFEWMAPYQPFLGGEPVQDVAVYFSTESKHDPADNGRLVDDPACSGRMPHVEAVLGACKALLDAHIPYGVITKRNLADLSRWKAIVLPRVLVMSESEADALREYVRQGGCLYASRESALQKPDGSRPGDYQLADVFGASYQGETRENFTYLSPLEGYENLFPGYTPSHPPGVYTGQPRLSIHPGARALGQLVLPYTDPAEPRHYASIHNNPPGIWTGEPALVLNRAGQGACLYSAVDLESAEHTREVFIAGLRHLLETVGKLPLSFEAQGAPKPVEITLFYQPENQRYRLSLVNFQKEQPNIPVEGIRLRLNLPTSAGKRQVTGVRRLPSGEGLPFESQDGALVIPVPRLETLLMLSIESEPIS